MDIQKNTQELVSYCGLYCGNCMKFEKGKCNGCKQNSKASWCKIRTCNIDHYYNNCADCIKPGFENCKKINHPVAKVFGFIFNSDRTASVQFIKDRGCIAYVGAMIDSGRMSIARRRK